MKAKRTGPTAKIDLPAPGTSSCSWPARTSPKQRTSPISVGSYHGFRETTENHGGVRDCVAAQGRGDHRGGASDAQRKSGGGTGHEGRSGAGRDLRGWRAAEKTRAAALFYAAQA